MCGLPGNLTGMFLNALVFDLIDKDSPLTDGQIVAKEQLVSIDVSVSMRIRATTTAMSDLVTQCDLYYQAFPLVPVSRPLRVLQVLWPNAAGEWPGPAQSDVQPLL